MSDRPSSLRSLILIVAGLAALIYVAFLPSRGENGAYQQGTAPAAAPAQAPEKPADKPAPAAAKAATGKTDSDQAATDKAAAPR